MISVWLYRAIEALMANHTSIDIGATHRATEAYGGGEGEQLWRKYAMVVVVMYIVWMILAWPDAHRNIRTWAEIALNWSWEDTV